MDFIKQCLAMALLFILVENVLSKYELNLPSASGRYKILMLLPFGSPSHRNCFIPLAKALADRGHQIVILSGLPPGLKHPNVTEVNHGLATYNKSITMFQVREHDITGGFSVFAEALPRLMSKMYNVPSVKDLYDRRHEFDLMIIDDLFTEPAYPFLDGKKFIAIGTSGIIPVPSAVLGNVLHPAYVSYVSAYSRPFSFLNRISNLFWHLYLPYFWRHLKVIPEIQKVASELFPNLPPLMQIERDGLVLILSNSHFATDSAVPTLPSQVEVGGMHCLPGKKLPEDLQSWIDGAGSTGVIYFSLGTVVPGTALPQKFKDIFVTAFSKLKQRVIWKFEGDLPEISENVIIRKWLPQQDILAHPNVKLFITHGGLLSSQEAVYHAKPALALPTFGDQPENAAHIQNQGFGRFLLWEELTVDLVVSTVQEIITNPTYQKKVSAASEAYRDQQSTPLETAVWWTEYVVRHDGAPLLRSPAADLSWIEFFMLDVILVIHGVIFAIYLLVKKIFKITFRSKLNSTKKSKRKGE